MGLTSRNLSCFDLAQKYLTLWSKVWMCVGRSLCLALVTWILGSGRLVAWMMCYGGLVTWIVGSGGLVAWMMWYGWLVTWMVGSEGLVAWMMWYGGLVAWMVGSGGLVAWMYSGGLVTSMVWYGGLVGWTVIGCMNDLIWRVGYMNGGIWRVVTWMVWYVDLVIFLSDSERIFALTQIVWIWQKAKYCFLYFA